MLERLSRGITRSFEILIVACLAIMGILVFGNVVLRYAFNSGIAISEELSRLLFVWLIFLGAVLASAQRIHIGFDTLLHAVGPRTRRVLVLLTGLLLLAGCVIFIVGGWRQTQINLDNSYPVLGISYAWLYGSSIVFGMGMAISILFNIWDAVTQPHTDEELIMTLNLGDRIEEGMKHVATGKSSGRSS